MAEAAHSAAMGPLDYRRHFLWLGGAVLAWMLVARLPSPFSLDRSFFLLGVSGALHATAIVLALRGRPAWVLRLAFVALAALVSIGALLVALATPALLGLHSFTAFYAGFGALSAVGAAAYWVLVRICWLPGLPVSSLFVTTGACVLSTFIATLALAYVAPRDVLLPATWWLAFSASLAWRALRPGVSGSVTAPPALP